MIDLLISVDTLEKIGEQNLNGVQAYKLGKIFKTISTQLQLYYTTRKKLLDEYGEKDEFGQLKIIDDGKIPIVKDKLNEFNNKLTELNNLQIELNFNPLNLNDLKEITLSPRESTNIMWLINEENPS